MLFCAAFHEISSLRTDYLLVDRLFEAIEVSLGHAKLHLILLLLAFHSSDAVLQANLLPLATGAAADGLVGTAGVDVAD